MLRASVRYGVRHLLGVVLSLIALYEFNRRGLRVLEAVLGFNVVVDLAAIYLIDLSVYIQILVLELQTELVRTIARL
jgi:hypothetical protein